MELTVLAPVGNACARTNVGLEGIKAKSDDLLRVSAVVKPIGKTFT